MHRESIHRANTPTFVRSTRLASCLIVLAASLATLPPVVAAYDSDPARTRAGDLEDHMAESGRLDGRSADSQDPEAITVESETMEEREVEAIDPGDRVTRAGDMEGREASSPNLTDLEMEAPDEGVQAIEIPGRADWRDTADPEVLVARKKLLRAQKRALAAREAYGEMMENNYPRGEARIRIVEERDASMAAFEQAKAELARAEDG